jgi:hypothetical protein
VEEEDVSDGSGRSNKSEVQEDDAEVIFDLLCKLFGFLICGIGNVGDIRHLVQCFLAHWYMKSCFWWFICSYCKHLTSFGFEVCRRLMMRMKTNLSTKAMIDILPFCLLLERQNHFWWEMRMSCRPFATCSAI